MPNRRQLSVFAAARGIGFHMGFADQPAVHAGIAQVIAHGHFADPEREAVPLRPVG